MNGLAELLSNSQGDIAATAAACRDAMIGRDTAQGGTRDTAQGGTMAGSARLDVNIPMPSGGQITGRWRPNAAERVAAFDLLVELHLQTQVIGFVGPDEGILREALTSLGNLSGIVRRILRHHGPKVSLVQAPGEVLFGSLAVTVVGVGVGSMVSKWHPALAVHEQRRPPGVDSIAHEQDWDRAEDLRADLDRVREALNALAGLLSQAANADLKPIAFGPAGGTPQ